MFKRLLDSILTITLGIVVIMLVGVSPAWADDDEEESGFSIAPPPFRYGHIFKRERENLSQASLTRITIDDSHADVLYVTPVDWYWMDDHKAFEGNPSQVYAGMIGGDSSGYVYGWLPRGAFAYELIDTVKVGKKTSKKFKQPTNGVAMTAFGGLGIEIGYMDWDMEDDDFRVKSWLYAMDWNIGGIGEIYLSKVSIVPYAYLAGALLGTEDWEVETPMGDDSGSENIDFDVLIYSFGFDVRIWRSKQRKAGDFYSLGTLIQQAMKSMDGGDSDATTFFLTFAMNNLFL